MQRIGWEGSGIEILSYSFLAIGQQGIWKGLPNLKVTSCKETYDRVQIISQCTSANSSLFYQDDT